MPRTVCKVISLLLVAAALACSGLGSGYEPGPTPARQPPPAPSVTAGPLALRVVHPPNDSVPTSARQTTMVLARDDYRIPSVDSTFVFGTAGSGEARVHVNGQPVPVYPTGAWIAWLPLAGDSIARFDVVGVLRGDTARVVVLAPVERGFAPPDSVVWIDSTSLTPRGDRWIRVDEGVRLSARAAPGAHVYLRLPDGERIRLPARNAVAHVPWGEQAFGTTTPEDPRAPPAFSRYEIEWTGPLGPDPGDVLSPDTMPADHDTAWVWIEAELDTDTARVRWPLRLGVVPSPPWPTVVVDDDTARTGGTDYTLEGRPSPYGTYHWFFPNGTVAAVSGRWNDQIRLQLSRATVAWVNAADVLPIRRGVPPPRGTTGAIRMFPGERLLTLRVPLPGRVPFRVDEEDRELRITFYGVAADMDWIQYGGTDSLVKLIAFQQPREDEAQVTVDMTAPVWGYRTRWVGNDLLLDIRRPPAIDVRRPLAGRLIALDPGHPPGGATGPTGLREPDVVLAVARKAARLFEEFGARVLLTRDDDAPLDLVARVHAAERAYADILVSIHANALPDGVNPFENNGTSVYYFRPRSALLARELNRALVRQFGVRDLGMGRGDLALARPTWMPAALTEGLFMMMPDQEAVLGTEDGQSRYARGIVEGVAAFLRKRALEDASR